MVAETSSARKATRRFDEDDPWGVRRSGAGFGVGKPAPTFTQTKGFGDSPLSLWQVAFDLGGEEEITRPYEQNPWVHAALKVVSEAVGSVDLQIWQSDEEESDEIPKSDALYKLFRKPNPLMAGPTLLEATLLYRRLDGECFWFLTDSIGFPLKASETGIIETPAQIWPVRGRVVEAVYQDLSVEYADGGKRTVKRQIGWRYTDNSGSKTRTWPMAAVVHFRDFDPENIRRGLGDVEVLDRTLTIQFQAERYEEGLLRNSGDPGGFLKVKGRLDQGEKDRVEQDLNETFGNPANRGAWKVLDDGQEYVPNSLRPKDMEFKDLLLHQRDIILAVLGVPPPLVGVYDNAHFNNIREAKKALWTGGNGVLAFLNSVALTLNAFFFPNLRDARAQKYVASFDTSSVEELREDTTEKIKAALEIPAKAIGVSANEALELFGVEHDGLEHGDKHFVNPMHVEVGAEPDPDQVDGEGEPGGGSQGTDDSSGKPSPSSTAPAKPADPNAVAAETGSVEAAGGLSLNGAQIQAVINLIADVAIGKIPRDSAHGILTTLFGLSAQQAETMLGSAGQGTKTTPNRPEGGDPNADPTAAPGAAPAKPAAEDEAEDKEDLEAEDEGGTKARGLDHDTLSAGQLRELREVDPVSWRSEYWRRFDKAVFTPGEKSVRIAMSKVLRDYFAALLARLRAVAGGQKGIRRYRKIFAQEVRKVTASDIAAALLLDEEEWSAKMKKAVGPKLAKIYAAALKDAFEDMGGMQIGVADPHVVAALSAQEIKLTEGVTSTLSKKVKRTLIEAFSDVDGSSIGTVQQAVAEKLPELEGSLRESFSDIDSRALTIARTETGQAANSARFLHMEENEVERHEWISAHDDEVRETHRYPYGDQVIVRVGEPFPNGLLHPHDPGAEAGEVINCRCTTAAVIEIPNGS